MLRAPSSGATSMSRVGWLVPVHPIHTTSLESAFHRIGVVEVAAAFEARFLSFELAQLFLNAALHTIRFAFEGGLRIVRQLAPGLFDAAFDLVENTLAGVLDRGVGCNFSGSTTCLVVHAPMKSNRRAAI